MIEGAIAQSPQLSGSFSRSGSLGAHYPALESATVLGEGNLSVRLTTTNPLVLYIKKLRPSEEQVFGFFPKIKSLAGLLAPSLAFTMLASYHTELVT